MMRAMVVAESLRDPAELTRMPHEVTARYPLPLNEGTVEIVEFQVPDEQALEVCWRLAGWLLPQRYFAQLNGPDRILVAFPSTVTEVVRDDAHSERRTQDIGELFAIPRSQMRFLDMFETDHPDVVEA